MYSAKILRRSQGPNTPILTSFELYYPRMVHAEFMTHRMLSRNSGSSRAIPVERLVETNLRDMHVPVFRKNRPGMQPGDYLTHDEQAEAERIWRDMAEYCANGVRRLAEIGVHKQWANRPLEWFGYIRVVASATDWNNFFALRKDVDEHMRPIAQDEIYGLAQLMKRMMEEHEPQQLEPGMWHLPYHNSPVDWDSEEEVENALKIDTARCARVSYDNLDGTPTDVDRDFALYEKLLGSDPLHASPAEHQATPDVENETPLDDYSDTTLFLHPWLKWSNWDLSGNLSPGWIQHRKLLLNEWVPG